MHLWHNVFPVDNDRRIFGCAQSHMQNGAVFRDVDLLAPEHGVDATAQAAFFCELYE
jgi:hypothetical protein